MTLNACFSSLFFLRAGVTEVHPHTHSGGGGGGAGDPQGSVTAMSQPYPWSYFYWLRKVSVPWKACNCINSNQAPSQGQLPSLESQPLTLGREKKSKQLALLGCRVIPWQRQSQSTYISTTKGKRLVWTGNNPKTSLCLCRMWRVSHHSPSLQTSPKKHSPTGCQAIAKKKKMWVKDRLCGNHISDLLQPSPAEDSRLAVYSLPPPTHLILLLQFPR